jgi:hypothetical protein
VGSFMDCEYPVYPMEWLSKRLENLENGWGMVS